MENLDLAEVVTALRIKLEEAMTSGEDQILQFEAKAIQVEFQVGVTKTADGTGKIKFWILELGGGGSRAAESIQKVTLELVPTLRTGGTVKIAKGTDIDPFQKKG